VGRLGKGKEIKDVKPKKGGEDGGRGREARGKSRSRGVPPWKLGPTLGKSLPEKGLERQR